MPNNMDMLRPMKPGIRGFDGAMDFKTGGARGAQVNSAAGMILQPSLEEA